ncbi:MAG: pyrimidine dimer DNA glycosylase/endonuclease V [Patescibacteria group bacterium]|nr:pyrimidine dimer DNA glycosylase/endonuclease V [Patescibacteria group bacterium]
MRVWDIPPKYLCREHLLGEHREVHAIWAILTEHKKGYSRHPETLRWRGKLRALYLRHEILVKEMTRRDYRHNSPLKKRLAKGRAVQTDYLHTPREQKEILRKKPCGCFV